ncbi:hypothetical protein HDV02_001940 [Globomyces sp. JEL0801]|nr:hypothetical protein HDV02_001940 [Globomyces sp. JEL0801]
MDDNYITLKIPRHIFASLAPSVKKLITGGCPVPRVTRRVTSQEREEQYWRSVKTDSPFLVQEALSQTILEKVVALENAFVGLKNTLAALPIPPEQPSEPVPNRIPTPPPPPPSWPYLAPSPPPQPCSGAPPLPPKPFRLRAVKLNHVSPVRKKRTRDSFQELIENGIKKLKSYSDEEEQQSSSSW